MKTVAEQSGKSRDFFNLLILLTVVLCVGIYLIVTTAIIEKDGVTFIKYAKQFETAPVKTMIAEFQHPGYPWLILMAHKIVDFIHPDSSILRWIYCGQGIALLFRLLTITVLYFLGKQLLGARMSFWGILILILLPKPAEYGSDALSDWPHLFFLAAGLLLLLKGAISERWWLFGFAGLSAGAGYLVRPECAQIAVLGSLWLGLQLLWSKHSMSKGKAMSALVLLIMGFLAIAVPYMNLKGTLFPKKNVGRFVQSSQQQEVHAENNQIVPEVIHTSQFTPSNISKALGKLVGNISETLMWFFVLPLLIGIYKWFKTWKWREPEKFFIITLIVVNVAAMIWLYCNYGYMSHRHILPLIMVVIFFVPAGIQELALWLEKKFSGEPETAAVENSNQRFYFFLLLLIGILICVPKLLRPLGIEVQGYRAAADWLKANTDITDVVAVPDKRINFYAERTGLVYENGNIPPGAAYVVKKIDAGNVADASTGKLGRIEYQSQNFGKSGKRVNIAIYKSL